MSPRWVAVAQVQEVHAQSGLVVEAEGEFIAIYRVDDSFYAVEDRCSHDGGSLEGGHTIGDQVVCPRHGARFCLRTGAATKAPAYAPITVYPIKREQDQLWVDLNR